MNGTLKKSLLKPESYPEPTSSVSLIETHVSFLFLTDRFVYKVKKPVDLGFVNFTTLDRRRFYCSEEVRLNRRLCPDLYLGIQEVRETAGGCSLTGAGKVVDYAVKMRRLPEECMLNRLLDRGEAGAAELARVAETVARFHLEAPVAGEAQRYGSIPVIREIWEENFGHAAGMPWISPGDLALVRAFVEETLTSRRGLFEERLTGGYVRECDGDLHLENICLADQVYIFDCIEFSERLRITDTAADVAFLLMDLEYHQKGELIPAFLEPYLALTADGAMLPLLPFYQSYRAFVRGKVAGLLLQEGELSEEKRRRTSAAARRYFRLSRGYALRGKLPPTLFITCGLPASGKSTLARELALQLGLTHLQSDAVRKELAGIPPHQRAAAPAGAGIYSAELDRKVYGALLARAGEALAGGRSVVVDATFRRAEDRGRFRALAAAAGASCHLLQLDCPEPLLRERLARRAGNPREISDASLAILPYLVESFELPEAGEGVVRVDGAAAPEESAEAVLRGMGLLP